MGDKQQSIQDGDKIEMSVSSSFRVNGGDNWFKYGVTSVVRPGESEEEAYTRVRDHLFEKFKETVYEAAEMISGMGE